MKLNINGYAQHGKDTVADMFVRVGKLIKLNASHFIAYDIMHLTDLGPYESLQECYEDRVNHRATWYDFIRERNADMPNYYVEKCLEGGDMFVGHRNRSEFELSKDMFDATIWVDASERGLPKEDISSCDLDVTGHDFVINNGRSLEWTEEQVSWIICLLKNKERAINAYS